MAIVEAKIQTVEDIYRLVWTAISRKQPISAAYKERPRLFCPHRLGRNAAKQLRVLCYQYGGESESGLGSMGSPENWRLYHLGKATKGRTGGRLLEDRTQSFPAGNLCRRRRYRC
jgi:hypothetical protein